MNLLFVLAFGTLSTRAYASNETQVSSLNETQNKSITNHTAAAEVGRSGSLVRSDSSGQKVEAQENNTKKHVVRKGVSSAKDATAAEISHTGSLIRTNLSSTLVEIKEATNKSSFVRRDKHAATVDEQAQSHTDIDLGAPEVEASMIQSAPEVPARQRKGESIRRHVNIKDNETGELLQRSEAKGLIRRSTEMSKQKQDAKNLDETLSKKGSPPAVNCEWGSYGSWQACDKSCGGGTQKRTRSVQRPAEHGGNECSGGSEETQSCNPQPCPIDCVFESWEDWDECSKTCGKGKQTRQRGYETSAQHGGKQCDGDKKEEKECNTHACPTTPLPVVKDGAMAKSFSFVLIFLVSALI